MPSERDCQRPEEDGTPPSPPAPPLIAVSWGEILDKVTILRIKRDRLDDPAKRTNVLRELDALEAGIGDVEALPGLAALTSALRAVNETLWTIEDDIRDEERRAEFGPRFVALARAVYHRNDERAAIKRRINDLLASPLVEEKSYRAY